MLKEAKKEAMRTGVNFQVRELKKEIDELVDREYRMWFQRSKALWAANGDELKIFPLPCHLKEVEELNPKYS